MSRKARPDSRHYAQRHARKQDPPRAEAVDERTKKELAQRVNDEISRIHEAKLAARQRDLRVVRQRDLGHAERLPREIIR